MNLDLLSLIAAMTAGQTQGQSQPLNQDLIFRRGPFALARNNTMPTIPTQGAQPPWNGGGIGHILANMPRQGWQRPTQRPMQRPQPTPRMGGALTPDFVNMLNGIRERKLATVNPAYAKGIASSTKAT